MEELNNLLLSAEGTREQPDLNSAVFLGGQLTKHVLDRLLHHGHVMRLHERRRWPLVPGGPSCPGFTYTESILSTPKTSFDCPESAAQHVLHL